MEWLYALNKYICLWSVTTPTITGAHDRSQAYARTRELLLVTFAEADSKYTEANFSLIPTYLFALQVAQMPRSPKLVIFVQTTPNRCTN